MAGNTQIEAAVQQTDFHHLLEPAERVQTAHKRKSRSNGAEKTPREARFRQHPLADTVPPRTPAQRRQLAAAMELLKDAGDGADDGADCQVEVLTLGDEVLWDYERYEIAVELGLEVRPIPFRGSDPAVRLCIETLHAPEFNGGLRALIAVVSCDWAARGRPAKLTLGVSFAGRPRAAQSHETTAISARSPPLNSGACKVSIQSRTAGSLPLKGIGRTSRPSSTAISYLS